MTTTLNHVQLQIMTNKDCSSRYGRDLVSKNMICAVGANNPEDNVCTGDSGGPLVIEKDAGVYVQVGVVSFSPARCNSGWPSGFTRISSYIDWIRENTDIK